MNKQIKFFFKIQNTVLRVDKVTPQLMPLLNKMMGEMVKAIQQNTIPLEVFLDNKSMEEVRKNIRSKITLSSYYEIKRLNVYPNGTNTPPVLVIGDEVAKKETEKKIWKEKVQSLEGWYEYKGEYHYFVKDRCLCHKYKITDEWDIDDLKKNVKNCIQFRIFSKTCEKEVKVCDVCKNKFKIKIKLKGEWESRKVWLNGKELKPDWSQEVWSHSSDGFNWGYPGSGPAQLALAICLELYDEQEAKEKHQDFKFKYISVLPQKDFEKEIIIE